MPVSDQRCVAEIWDVTTAVAKQLADAQATAGCWRRYKTAGWLSSSKIHESAALGSHRMVPPVQVSAATAC